MAYDAAHGANRSCSADSASSEALGDYWLWDGSIWQLGMVTAAAGARGRVDGLTRRKRSEPCSSPGRRGAATPLTDTWEWDGFRWVTTANDAPALAEGCAAYDPTRRRIVLYGGRTTGGAILSDTWQYHAHGNACQTAAECDTSACVDGLCCEQSSCGSCHRCNDPERARHLHRVRPTASATAAASA